RARDPVVARRHRTGHARSRSRIAGLGAVARVAVAAGDRRAATRALAARVVQGAQATVVARQRVRDADAAVRRVACVVAAGISVVARQRDARAARPGARIARFGAVADVAVVAQGIARADPGLALIVGRAEEAVVARQIVVRLDAAPDLIARVVGARIVV